MADDLKDLDRSILPRLHPDEAGHLRDELSQLRAFIGRSDSLAVAGGPALAWWGLVISVAMALDALRMLGRLPMGVPIGGGEMVLGFGGAFLIAFYLRKRHDLHSWRSRAIPIAWIFSAVSILVFAAGCERIGIRDPRVTAGFVATLYALVLAVTATATGRKWLFAMAVGWLGTAFAMFQIDNFAFDSTLFSLAAVAFMLLPGLVLWALERQARQRQAQQ